MKNTVLSVFFVIALASCSTTTEKTSSVDSTSVSVDSTTVIVDSVAVDTTTKTACKDCK